MAKKRRTKKGDTYSAMTHEAQRRLDKRELQRAVATEKKIQSLAKQLDREMQRTNDRLQRLATSVSSIARALEAERDVDRSLEQPVR
jgi:hypothetical protein